MKQVCAKAAVTRGVDMYHGDAIRDINEVKTFANYAYLKAFEYTADSLFLSRWKAMKTAGIIRGAYDFFHPSRDPVLQAERFLKLITDLEPGDLPPSLDWESTDGIPSAKDRESAYAWLLHVEAATKKTPIIYGAPYFLNDVVQFDNRFARFPLWIAHYGVKCPLVPSPWKTWAFWQGSESSAVPGMSGACDTDVFNGDLGDLKNFISRSNI